MTANFAKMRVYSVLALLFASSIPAVAKTMEKPMFKDKYVHVNGVRLHVVTAGKGPLILFLHGFPEFWYEWKDQLAEFGKDHLAVAPDHARLRSCRTSRGRLINTK